MLEMHAEQRIGGYGSVPGLVCCGKFYLRQRDAMAHLRKAHNVDQAQAVQQVRDLVLATRGPLRAKKRAGG